MTGRPLPHPLSNSRQFQDHVASLPKWDDHLDDDPNWVRPTGEAGNTYVEHDDHFVRLHQRAGQLGSSSAVDVPVEGLKTSQPHVRLDAVQHYINPQPQKHYHGQNPMHYDPDPWFGTEHPVVGVHPTHGHVVLDGNSRVTAARLRGDKTIRAHIVK